MSSVIRGSDNFNTEFVFGNNLTPRNVLPSRTQSVPVLNNSDETLVVSIYITGVAQSGNITVEGVIVSSAATVAGVGVTMTAFVSPGQTYTYAGSTPSLWVEYSKEAL